MCKFSYLMAYFDQKAFNDFIVDNNVIGFKPEGVQLKSGRTAHWYVNWRTVAQDVFLFDQLVDFVIAYTRDRKLDPLCFYGVPEGATKIGLFAQYKWAKLSSTYGKDSHPLAMGRAMPKEHGDAKDRFFVGMPRGNTVVLEDVTTTGGSLISTIEALKSSGIKVVAAIGLTNRREKDFAGRAVEDAVLVTGTTYYAMSNALELLPLVYKKNNPGNDVISSVEAEFKEFGVAPLQFK